MFFKAKLWSLSTWHWQSQGKCTRPFCYGEATHNFEIQDCRDLGVLE